MIKFEFECAALDLVADELERMQPEDLFTRRYKLIAVLRNVSAWLKAEQGVPDVR